MRWTTSALFTSCLVMACSAGSGSSKGPEADDEDSREDVGEIDVEGPGEGEFTQFDGTVESDVTGPVVAAGAPFSVQFTLKDRAGNPVSGADWSTDDTRIGSVSAEGVFTGSGFVGGVVKVTANVGGAIATAEITVNVDITQNDGGPDSAGQSALIAGGSGDSTFKWLYPYAGTVFPQGVESPLLQLAGTSATGVFVSIETPHFSYKLFSGGSAPVQIRVPQEVWRGLSLTARPGVDAVVNVSKSGAEGVTGPATSTWQFASASLKGIVYYSTYDYPTGASTFDAAIMRVRAGEQAEVLQLGCTACHTVSANGSVMATGLEYLPTNTTGDNPADDGLNPIDSVAYNLSEAGDLTQRSLTNEGRTFSFMGLTPDGSRGVTNGIPADKWPPHISHGVRSVSGTQSELIDTATGQPVASNLSDLVSFAQSPAFSPDGTRLVFANGDILTADSNQRVLSVLDVDLSQTPVVFSNLRNIAESSPDALAWPTFLPDANGVVYHEGDSLDSHKFNGQGQPYLPQYAELRLTDIAAGTTSELNALNGRGPDGTLYLPHGEVEEGRMNYEASVLPVAVGGYYWVLFTSRRTYGNTIAPDGALEEEFDPWGKEDNPSARKKIWIAAIDVDYAGKADPSHPAFYLPGQGIESGNMRGFAAMAPCRPDGQTCESGSDCCGGFCRETSRDSSGTPELTCVPPPDTCSNTDELCDTAADCCNKSQLCIANRCTETVVR